MWKICKLVLLFVGVSVCHCGCAALFSYLGINVNFMLLFALAFCAVAPVEQGYPVAFLCGLFLDMFGAKLFGNNAFSFTVAACIMYSLRDRFDFTGFLPQIMAVFVLSCLVSLLNSWLVLRFTGSSMWPGIGSLAAGAGISVLIAPIMFALVRRVWIGAAQDERA